jgi:hypothetical protein
MITPRYSALSLIPLAMLLLGFAALSAPEPLRGPLIAAQPFGPDGLLGLRFFAQPLYLADAIGLVLLALATLEIWVLAITWEYRRHHRPAKIGPR